MESVGEVLSVCSNCRSEGLAIEKFCPNCGYPETGTEEEQRNFRMKINGRKRLIKDAEKKIRTARTILIVIAGLNLLVGVFLYFTQEDLATFVANTFLCIVYLGLAAWTNQNPFGAILTALIVYLTLWALAIFLEPENIYRGIIIKIFLISALIKGIKSAREAKEIRAQLPVTLVK